MTLTCYVVSFTCSSLLPSCMSTFPCLRVDSINFFKYSVLYIILIYVQVWPYARKRRPVNVSHTWWENHSLYKLKLQINIVFYFLDQTYFINQLKFFNRLCSLQVECHWFTMNYDRLYISCYQFIFQQSILYVYKAVNNATKRVMRRIMTNEMTNEMQAQQNRDREKWKDVLRPIWTAF